jgi:hypothetical protein
MGMGEVLGNTVRVNWLCSFQFCNNVKIDFKDKHRFIPSFESVLQV